MKKFSVVLLILSFSSLPGQTKIFDTPLSPRIANYTMHAELLPDEKAVKAEYALEWKNLSADTVRDLQFHLYLNAFKNDQSTFMKESGGRHRDGVSRHGREEWGFVDIRSLRIENGEELTKSIQFIQPDDDNAEDQTVIRVPLPDPILPGKSIRLRCEFFSKLPRVFARTGFTEDGFFMIGQWFPKIGVWENGRWNCHQFHSNSEFFADFGVYDMNITVPAGFEVAANGILIDKKPDDQKIIYHFYQEDVIDAVWAASEKYTSITEPIPVGKTGRSVAVTYFLQKDCADNAQIYRAMVPAMLQYADEWIGVYPYRNLTIVEPPSGEGMTAGGMEYPTLFTTAQDIDIPGLDWIVRVNWMEIVTFHEFLHNYFQSMVASNEFEEPWLDEGFTSYMEHRFLKRYFKEKELTGDYANILGMAVNSLDYHRQAYINSSRMGVMSQKAWGNDYFYAEGAYSKPTLALTTLQNYLGEDTMNLVIREYFRRWSFKHPRTPDVIKVAQEETHKDLGWFFDQYLFTPKTVDYEAVQIRNVRQEERNGWFGINQEKEFLQKDSLPGAPDKDDPVKTYHSLIRLRNNGDAWYPVDILITFNNQDTVWRHWDGQGIYKEFHFINKSPVESFIIDPDFKNALDLNFANNSKTKRPETAGFWRYATRILFWTQSVFQKLAMFI